MHLLTPMCLDGLLQPSIYSCYCCTSMCGNVAVAVVFVPCCLIPETVTPTLGDPTVMRMASLHWTLTLWAPFWYPPSPTPGVTSCTPPCSRLDTFPRHPTLYRLPTLQFALHCYSLTYLASYTRRHLSWHRLTSFPFTSLRWNASSASTVVRVYMVPLTRAHTLSLHPLVPVVNATDTLCRQLRSLPVLFPTLSSSSCVRTTSPPTLLYCPLAFRGYTLA